LLVISVKIVEIRNLLGVLFLFILRNLSIISDQSLDLLGIIFDLVVLLFHSGLKLSDVRVHFVLDMLSTQSLAHTIGDRAFVKSLVSLNGHFDLITDTHQQEATFSTVDSNLSDELIEALGEKFFTEWADSSLSR